MQVVVGVSLLPTFKRHKRDARTSEKQEEISFLRKQTTPSKILSNFRHPSRGGEFFCNLVFNEYLLYIF